MGGSKMKPAPLTGILTESPVSSAASLNCRPASIAVLLSIAATDRRAEDVAQRCTRIR